jgi:hypothetical protein
VLTIKTMPALLDKLQKWRHKRNIGHFFSGVHPGPEYLKAEILGENFFKADSETILKKMPTGDTQNNAAKAYMAGILHQINSSKRNYEQIKNLIIFLDEKDRRRGTSWKNIFPWLSKINY